MNLFSKNVINGLNCRNKLWYKHLPHKDATGLAGDKDGLHGGGGDVSGQGAHGRPHGDDEPSGAYGDDPGEAFGDDAHGDGAHGDGAHGEGQHWGEEGDQQPEGGQQGRTRCI